MKRDYGTNGNNGTNGSNLGWIFSVCFVISVCSVISLQSFSLTQSKKTDEIEKKITALLEQMTLEEKLGQLQQLDGHADGRYRELHAQLIRKGRLGSTLNVRGAARTNELQRVA